MPLSGPSTPDPPRWGLLRLLAVAVASFAAAAIVSLGLVLLLGTARKAPQARTPEEILLIVVLSDGALLLVLFALGRRLLRIGPRDLGLRAALGPRQVAFAVFAAGGLWVLSIFVNAIQIALFGPNPQALVVSVGAHRGLQALLLDLLAGALVAPVAEEVLYRGLLFGGLHQRLPFAVAASLSGLLFAASHGLGVLLPIFVLGVGLAFVYWRTGTLWAPIITHAGVNAISLVLVSALPRS